MVDPVTPPDVAQAPLEADAVCERCGTVNPEDTLLCRHCGNNLREQRARRLSAGRAYEDLGRSSSGIRLLTGLLAAFGLLLILLTALNAGRIEAWLAAVQTSSIGSAEAFFSGGGAAAYESLANHLKERPATRDQLERALSSVSAIPDSFEGRYLVVRTDLPAAVPLGEAQIAKVGDALVVVARLAGDLEVRGRGHIDERGVFQATQAAVRSGEGEYLAGYGFAHRAAGGGLQIYAVLENSPAGFRAAAYAVPDMPRTVPD